LDQETVDVGSINSFKGRLDKIKKNKDGLFYGFCMVRKALGLKEIGPREATQGELQGELLTHGSVLLGKPCERTRAGYDDELIHYLNLLASPAA